MKNFLVLTIFLMLGAYGRVVAQDAAAASKRANQQYVLFESERDKGTNVTGMYSYLLDSYENFMKVVEAPDNGQYLSGAKNRLRAMYPYLLNGAVYYSEQKQPSKALDFAAAYIEMPRLKIFQSELLPKDNRYASVVYYAAVSAYNLQKYSQALKYFQEYLSTGTDTQQKDCYVYMNMIYQSQKNYSEQERVLEEAIAKYPVSLDFLYNLVNVHIATNNMPKLLSAIDRILEVDPNNDKVLPIKARILERQGKNQEALDIYKRLYALHPDSFELLTGLARVNFNVATEIVNNGATIANDTEYALVRQRASGYLLDAKEGASVYLGLKNGINKDDMIRDLREAQKGEIVFDTEKYVNKLPAKKHDHYLIPGGTVHCSGSEALVLEISSTPNLFTFKLWDWQRLGLDGKPRPINVERGKEVIDWKRNTEYVKEYLANHFTQIAEGEGWSEERTGLHPNEFIETRRHWFSKSVTHHTNNSVNVLNLVEGEEAVIESPINAFKPFVVHYAETFIIPAGVGEYTIAPYGKSVGQECGTIKAYVRY